MYYMKQIHKAYKSYVVISFLESLNLCLENLPFCSCNPVIPRLRNVALDFEEA